LGKYPWEVATQEKFFGKVPDNVYLSKSAIFLFDLKHDC